MRGSSALFSHRCTHHRKETGEGERMEANKILKDEEQLGGLQKEW